MYNSRHLISIRSYGEIILSSLSSHTNRKRTKIDPTLGPFYLLHFLRISTTSIEQGVLAANAFNSVVNIVYRLLLHRHPGILSFNFFAHFWLSMLHDFLLRITFYKRTKGLNVFHCLKATKNIWWFEISCWAIQSNPNWSIIN